MLPVFLLGCNVAIDNESRLERAQQAVAAGELRPAAIELKNVLQSDPTNVAARVLLGRVSLQAGDPVSAVKELQRALELGAAYQEVAVPLARSLLATGNPQQVLEMETADLADLRDRADLHAAHGNAWLQQSDMGRAETSFQQALRDYPGHVEALVGMARVHVDRGNNAAAERALNRVITQHPDTHAAYAVLGRLQLNAAEFDAAEASFRKAMEHSQDESLALRRVEHMSGLVDVLLIQKRAGEAQDVASRMLDIAPMHPFALFQAARADFEVGDMDAAIEKTQSVIAAYTNYQPARLLLAAAAMSKENFALAEMHLQSLVASEPDNVEARKLLAQAKLSMGNPDEAFRALQPLLESGAADPRLLAMAGSAGLRSGKREQGLEYLTRGAQAGLDDRGVQLQTALSFIEAGTTERALEVLNAMPESMHGNERNNLLMLAMLRSGDTDSAGELARSIVASQPDDPAAHKLLGSYQLAVKDRAAARVAFDRALELDPDDTAAAMHLARIDTLDGNVARAARRYEQLIDNDPEDIAAYLGLAEIAEKGGDQERAVALLETALKENPRVLQPALLLARYYLNSGKNALALARAEQAVEISPGSVAALNMLGAVQLGTNRHSEALGTFERALQNQPADTLSTFNLAQAQLKLGMADSGRKSLERVLEIQPDHRAARVALTRIESLSGNYAAALQIVEGLQADDSENADLLVLEGDIHVMRKHYNDAIAAYDTAGTLKPSESIALKRHQARVVAGRRDADEVLEEWLQEHPGSVAVRVALAQSLQNTGRSEQAIAEYGRALEIDPADVVALNNLAWLYAEMGGPENLQQGLAIAKRAHRQMPDLGQVTDTYGWLLLLQGEIDEAARKLREAARQAPEDPDIRYHLAVALQRQGADAEARDLLDAILQDNSGFSSRDAARSLRESL